MILKFCIGQGESNNSRQRRQNNVNLNNRNIGIQSGNLNNPNGLISNDQNNQQQPSQGQRQLVRSGGYYSSPNFKPPSFSGDKPIGWFDTKYPNWVSNQNNQLNNNPIDGKNAPPSRYKTK